MKISELKQIIKEEISKVLNEKDEMDQSVKNYLDSGDFVVINPKNLKVGDNIVRKNAMDFAEVKKINNDKVTISYSDGDRSTLRIDKVVQDFLKVVPE
jgi:hypothetical protein